MFEGIWIPLVTPFHRGQIDTAALHRLVRHYQDAGVAGFVALGTTGEAALLSQVERYTVLETIAEASGGRTPFLIGIGAPDTHEMASQLRHYERWPAAGYLVPPPYYICPSQAGLRWHFSQIAAATSRPIVLYNVPKRTGVSIAPHTALILAEIANIVAIKECVADQFAALQGGPLQVLSGGDGALLKCLRHGGSGGILAGAHIRPDRFVALVAHFRAGRLDTAAHLAEQLAPLAALLFAEPNPAPVKALLAEIGLIRAETRPPILPVSDTLRARLTQALAALDEMGMAARI
ncbi:MULTISPECIES: 4-hydroxy-tetrahydrodipicolinate synthase [Ralstonia solanacearum species complex]|uniref:4-hydroxy-tetrahydrodipicolinate synthase n=2 Tax=Ralstonia solanacearum TaxID=305 RepID=A0ABF7RAK3_RALSL|nr:4-hydroxy-tetrahydrodipicolinate synthase [Ralstonia solanacearum]ALF88890.1 4-hydroxy-tetrahydrodipicolinate synthase [Ralstonia solanacearum]ATI28311.1 4-hydroxy-tetrahydrodipicolinate synthase [Ralstonia solanacearum]KEI31739.1 dihydrodipicolinate synthase [Ralstonia solanacearum]KFX78330.1 dihydrodipicolinate synthase [Ralstonia solanacearum]KFX84251.1 dihydrodipicolinate synthase [Ralstonia solanacearum]